MHLCNHDVSINATSEQHCWCTKVTYEVIEQCLRSKITFTCCVMLFLNTWIYIPQIYLSFCLTFIKYISKITGHPFMGWQLKVSQCTPQKTIEISSWYTLTRW